MTVSETKLNMHTENMADTIAVGYEEHIRELARVHAGARRSKGSPLPILEQPKQFEDLLRAAYQRFAHIADEELTVSYAGEWLLDNFYVIQQAMDQVLEDIPASYYAELPKLTAAPFEHYARVYALARVLFAGPAAVLSVEQIKGLVAAYQEITPLTMGELWALPAMLRVTSLENLTWAVCQLAGLTMPPDLFPASEIPGTVADETLVANSVMNLRGLAVYDWKVYFEAVSRVDQILRQDPAGIYAGMDFETRNRYRGVIEELAPETGAHEEDTARAAVALAQEAGADDQRARHVGYYLIGAGRPRLEAALGFQPDWQMRLERWARHHNIALYLGSVALLCALMLIALTTYTHANHGAPLQLVLALLVGLLPATAAAVQIVNWVISRTVAPSMLPKMDFSEGIPDDYTTLVVIPALLTDVEEAESLIQQLELHFLRNNDSNLLFALLADLADAPQQHMPGDSALQDYVQKCLHNLNAKYQSDGKAPFYLFVRERRWNAAENTWMAWERKRGKLRELNWFLLDPDTATSFIIQDGDLKRLRQVSFVITLDADTILPKDNAHRLVAALAHPLNRPVFDPVTRMVTSGYAILQPRVDIIAASTAETLFASIFAGDTSLDLYTHAVSDAYQDWFDEGVYVGKGIYDVSAFEHSLEGRIPENRLLSHDLFEGLHARVALVTDVVLLEDYPPHYLVHLRRLHRWVRGDWQLLPWLFPQVPGEGGTTPNYLSALDRWKILDNLRRSLVTPALFLLLLAGWLVLPGSAWFWTVVVLFVTGLPFLTNLLNQVRQISAETNWGTIGQQLLVDIQRWLLALVFLPHESLMNLDAIVTTLTNLRQRRHLLQWVTSARTARLFGQEHSPGTTLRQMYTSVGAALAALTLIILVNPAALPVALPILLFWLISPWVAHYLSLPLEQPSAPLSESQIVTLRRLARRTWFFFEEYVGPVDHWLPPDHYRESPGDFVAHHTSPTNIGLLLLTTLAAYDFGYIGLLDLSTRLKLTLETLANLERYRGHFLNWYDTRTLKPLPPRYVSTVDSGNMVGHLMTLRQGLTGWREFPIMRAQRWQGLLDTLAVLEEVLSRLEVSGSSGKTRALHEFLSAVRQQIAAAENDPIARTDLLPRLLEESWPEFDHLLRAFLEAERDVFDAEDMRELRLYTERVHHHLRNTRRDTEMLLPWLFLLQQPPQLFLDASASGGIHAAWDRLAQTLLSVPTLGQVAARYEEGRAALLSLRGSLNAGDSARAVVSEAAAWCDQFAQSLDDAEVAARQLVADLEQVITEIDAYTREMDFAFLFNDSRKVFHIGYNLDTDRLDNSFYDLLASEARLASLIAIALDTVSHEHWLYLGRPMARVNGTTALLSWSGTMFEYLMPRLVMRNYPNTLLDQSYRAAVHAHIRYARQRQVPWGISESGYYAFDANLNYQYRAFGAPDIAFKRGLATDLVISPYASLLALPVNPHAVLDNYRELEALDALGTYGLYEAIDYTPGRLPLGQARALVREYMAHHQGMILLTLANYLHDDIMVERFHSDPRIQSVELLLLEQIPKQMELRDPTPAGASLLHPDQPPVNTAPWPVLAHAPVPQVHYLSNGEYGLFVTSAGAGYSQWGRVALTRWRADTTREDWGTWVYLRDQDTDEVWSIGAQPMNRSSGDYHVLFYPHKAEFQRRNQDIAAQMEVTVPPYDNLEIRRIRLTNPSDRERRLLLSSYGEVVLAPQDADQRHPAFNKIFIEGEFVPEVNGLLFRRRPRSAGETPLYMLHLLLVEPEQAAESWYETDRARFLGRGRTPANPAALAGAEPGFTMTTGATLDPIMALGTEVVLQPHGASQVAYITLAGDSRSKLLRVARAYLSWAAIDRVFDQARYQSELELRRLDLSTPEIEQFQRLLSALLYPQPTLRADPATLAANTKGQPGLWAHGISGDFPILVVRMNDESELLLARDLIRAHIYWRNRQIRVTLVILNQRDTGYTQELYNQVHRLIVQMGSEIWINRHDGIFLLRADLLNDADRFLLAASARVFLDGKHGTLAQQLDGKIQHPVYLPAFTSPVFGLEQAEPLPDIPRPANLLFDNGYGGFDPQTNDYVIYSQPGQPTPAPWLNVVANPDFGFTVSESGGGFTWAGNSSENRLTAWRNDPVSDMPSEAVYLRDEETAEVWTPTPLPAGGGSPCVIRHGAGYSVFERHSHGMKQQLSLFAALDEPVKIIRLRLENAWARPRRITTTYYAEWVMGTVRDVTQQYIIPEFQPAEQTLLAHNPYSIEFGGAYLFVTASKDFHGLTTNRTEFLGRLGDLSTPAALKRIGLSGQVEPGVDTCAAVQLHIDLPSGGVEEVYFILGSGANREAALQLAHKFRQVDEVNAAWEQSTQFWRETLASIEVQTPDQAMNVLLPWLLYQDLACRIWGRSALYQSSGAYGFRDQLQDVMAVVHVHPDIAREHILRAARHQFEAGDVLHWWHPPSGRGVRTRFSDDLIWLPFVTAQYIAATGDVAILEATIPFLKGEPLRQDEEERYGHYEATAESYSLYEHCRRALNRGLTSGAHGLPLMGAGDWNDGMSRVGIEGHGESVWVGWFLYTTMSAFIPLCERMDDQAQADTWRLRLPVLQAALEQHAWDGAWYRRAYYDDGTPLGSAQNDECQIDSIAQSWAVISGAADPARARQAMESVMQRLVKPDDGLLLLFTPPFDQTTHDPGYIKGYPPGIRENGGQYTHAALWTVWALAEMGDGDRAEALFRLLNPVYHAETMAKAGHYRVEPYVIAADVYGAQPHTGRGGWTWYTGSGGWMYRLGVEMILGLRREGDKLRLEPAIPRTWREYTLAYRFGKSVYRIRVDNAAGVSHGVRRVTLDGNPQADLRIPLVDDATEHHVIVEMG